MTRTIATALAALLAGCSAASTVPTVGPCMPSASNTCPLANLVLGVEITPADPGLVANEFSPLTVDPTTGLIEVHFEKPVMLSGVVRVGSGVKAHFLDAVVHATRPSRIPGRNDVFYDGSVDTLTSQYHMLVSPTHDQEVYTIRVVSSDVAEYPPQTFQLPIASDTAFDLVLDDPATLTQITGAVRDTLQQGIIDMEVVAVDPATRTPVSTVTTTDAAGNFVVRVSRQAPAVVLVVATPVASQDGNLPELVTPVDVSRAGPANTVTANVVLPPLPAVQPYTYSIVGRSTSGADMAVSNATCRFSADVSDPASPTVATFTAVGHSDADGAVTALLVPASDATRSYALTVSPPATSIYQTVQQVRVDVGPMGGYAASIPSLAPRPQLVGRVLDSDLAPVSGVAIVPGLSSAAKANDATALALAQAPTQITDDKGKFTLRLDADYYDVGFWPTRAQTLPRWWLSAQSLTSDVDLGDVVLPPGVLAAVIGFGPSGEAVIGADVRVYSVAPSNYQNATCSDPSCLAPPRLIAQSTTDPTGRAPVVLPADAALAQRHP
jgi:hypothetical protein